MREISEALLELADFGVLPQDLPRRSRLELGALCNALLALGDFAFELAAFLRSPLERLIALCDEYQIDYVILARYMRLLPAASCWKYAGGRIINLHHGLLPAFPGAQPYRDAYSRRMLTYGATVHFIVPELDAGDQIIHQDTFTVAPGTPLEQIVRVGESDHEPTCLVEGLRRVLDREVTLHFHKVVPVPKPGGRGA